MDKNVFFQKYLTLTKEEQELLQMMNLVYEPLPKAKILECAKKCGILSDKHTIMQRKIRIFCNNHLSQTQESGSFRFYIDKSVYKDFLLKYCLKNPNITIYMEAIHYLYPYEKEYWPYSNDTLKRIERDFYFAFFQDNRNDVNKYYKKYLNEAYECDKFELFSRYLITKRSFNAKVADLIPNKFKAEAIANAFLNNDLSLKAQEDIIYYLEDSKLKCEELILLCYNILAYEYLEKEEFDKLKELLKKKEFKIDFYTPSLEFIKGNIEKAYDLYLKAFKEYLGKSKRAFCPDRLLGEYFCLTLIAMNQQSTPLFNSTVNKGVKEHDPVYSYFKALLLSETGNEQQVLDLLKQAGELPTDNIIHSILIYFIDKKRINNNYSKDLAKMAKKNLLGGKEWLAYNFYALLRAVNQTSLLSLKEIDNLEALSKKYLDITTIIKQEEDWKKSLNKLKNISKGGKKIANSADNSARIVWLIDIDQTGTFDVTPKEQLRGKKGEWSKGRPVALKRIMQNKVNSMSELDKSIGRCIKEESWSNGWGYETSYVMDKEASIPYFIEHPYLFLEESPKTHLELIKGTIQLIIKENKNTFNISISEQIKEKGFQFIRETASRYKVLKVTETELNISKILGVKSALSIPKTEKKALKTLISDMSSILPIHSDIKAASETGKQKIKTVKADSSPHIHLLPVEEGVRAELFVKPFKAGGSFFKPSMGGANVIAEINGQQQQTSRQLSNEKSLAEAIIDKCPSLALRGKYNDIFEFDTAYEALDALLELQKIKDDITIHWPEGEKFKILNQYSVSDMNISVTKSNDWFELSGSLNISENKIIDLQQLLANSATSKFIELNNGEFIALTEELKRKIEAIAGFAFSSKNKIKIHPLNANFADEILSEMKNFKSNTKWKQNVKKAQIAIKVKSELPSTLQAELRPYQLEGFNWLSRLSHWGVGACLADDMGLGKTIQALAIILERAKDGPTLVVAPASVCLNWIAEAAKFAPTLNAKFFGTGDRNENLKDLKPFDLMLCTYGLLLSEEKNISEINWTTTVLDEAQSIKNFKAKRTQAAFNLKSDFRLITTGTPVENHLSELWTLFTFLNPGFLGTKSEFDTKFATPIEKDNDPHATKALKKMIKPFILRRLKTQVLEDLPPKTEINININLSDEELAFYEALRRDSVNNIENLKEEKGAGAIHLQILAELTKLRRACCHSTLVSDKVDIESSKLKNFINIVEELKENNHKALVFSQFTGHLAIIRKVCDERKISYQYLDGSTPTKKRQELVNKFQAGEGDIFLISLKAGGTGLNLTAADYVIHMDPWWNPAVEDQASDRAHRIGQQRPVTVYRFVTKNTVEERIIALHKKKRALADSLLDGTDVTGKMSAKDLLDLFK